MEGQFRQLLTVKSGAVQLGPDDRYLSYAEMVSAMDQRVGRIVRALDQLGLRENTLLLFVADNGTPHHIIETAVDDQLIYRPVVSNLGNQKIPGGKGQPTDWGTRVPMIALWPGKIAPGQVTDALVDMSDFLPTLVSLAGAKLPQSWKLDGHSFAPALLNHSKVPGGSAKERQWAFAQRNHHAFVKDRRWKLYGNGRFYDTLEDSWEKHPLQPQHLPSPAAESYKRLEQAIKSLGLPDKYRNAMDSKEESS